MPTHPGWATFLVIVLVIAAPVCFGATSEVAWLVPHGGGQVAAPEGAATFSSFEFFLQPGYLAMFDTLVLTGDYHMSAATWGAKQVQLERNLTIMSAAGYVFILDFDFIKGGLVVPSGVTLTLKDLAIAKVRKISGWALPFFTGNGGVVRLLNVVRMRLVCLPVANTTVSNLNKSPRPDGFPGQQQVSMVDYYFRGTVYRGSVHDTDLAMFLGPGDVDDSAAYAGYTMVQLNVTRVCGAYTPPGCTEQPDACLEHAVENVLAAMAEGPQQDVKRQVAIAVPVVVVAGLLISAAAFYLSKHVGKRRLQQWQKQIATSKLRQLGSLRQLQHEQNGQQHNGGSCARLMPAGYSAGSSSGGGCSGHLTAAQVEVGLSSGTAGTIEDVAPRVVASAAGGSGGAKRNGWQVMACHNSPDFGDATPKDKIALGVLLGVGSFGRVYKGVWRGMDVAVKVLHHGTLTAAAVANEVDLIMSFRHPNITTAYHFVTWDYEAIATADANRNGSAAAAAEASSAAPAGVSLSSHIKPSSSNLTEDSAGRVLLDGCSRHYDGAVTAGSTQSISSVFIISSNAGATAATAVPAAAGQEEALLAGGVLVHAGGKKPKLAAQPESGPAVVTAVDACHVVIPVAGLTHGMLYASSGANGQHWTHVTTGVGSATAGTTLSTTLSSSNFGKDMYNGASLAGETAVLSDEGAAGRPPVAAAPAVFVHELGKGFADTNAEGAREAIRGNKSPSRRWSDTQVMFAVGSLKHAGQQQQQDEQLFASLPPLRLPGKRHVQQCSDCSQRQKVPQQMQQQQQQHYIPAASNNSLLRLQHYSWSAPAALQQQQRLLKMPAQQQQQEEGFPRFSTVPAVSGAATAAGSGSSNSMYKPGQVQGEAQTWLLMEFCDGGTLLDVLQDGRLVSKASGQVSMAHVLTLLCDVAAGMSYLHSRNVLHGDLKPGNVLLKRQQGAPFGHVCKVTDFGMSRCLNAGQSHRSTRTMGTVNHTSPELLRMGRLSAACDVFAFGILMWELFTGQVAWAGQHYGEVFERVALLQERPPIPPHMPAEYTSLMTLAWAADPFQRPTFDVIRHRLVDMLDGIVQDTAEAEERFISDL